MAEKTEEQVKVKKGIKKQFFEVSAPLTASKIMLYAGSIEELEGKTVKLDLTRNLRGKNLVLKLKVRNDSGNLVADVVSLELAGVFIRRMIRKGSDYVEDSFITECKDGKVVVKPFMITRNKVSRAVRKALRDEAKKYLLEYLNGTYIKDVCSDIISNKLQKTISLRLKKIYPLAFFGTRRLLNGRNTDSESRQEPGTSPGLQIRSGARL